MKFLLYILSAILTGFIFFLLFGLLHLIGIKINPDTAAKIIFVAMIVFFPLIPLVIYNQQQQRAIRNAEKKGIRVAHETALEEVSATIIDNRTGDEVMTFYAREVLPKLDAKTFADTIAENTK